MRTQSMIKRLAQLSALSISAAVFGCGNLDVPNPNAPDAQRALSDPAALEAVGAGTLRTWVNAWSACEGNCVFNTQAQSYSASWNNFNMNFYSSIDADGTRNSRSWQNNPAAAGRTSVEAPWTAYYSAISSATDVLSAIRNNHVELSNSANTKRLETVAGLAQAMSLMQVALLYDKGYIVDETIDIAALQYSNRKLMRDDVLKKLDAVIALAGANTFQTPANWLNGPTLSNVQVKQLANTLAAMTLAYWPRNAAEAAAVDWNRVVTYASQGISSGTAFNFSFVGDGCTAWCPEQLSWMNSMDTGRLSTRVANMLDPVTQRHPYPTGGNPRPNSADRRLGDGSFGNAGMVSGFGNLPKTANAGTDFAWSSQAIFNNARGSYHQSNIAHIRYDLTGTQDPSGIYYAYGPAALINATVNDLIWAEALIRSNGSLGTAATLINKTRVTRGGLSAAAAGDGATLLTTRLQYEQEVELAGLGPIPYYNRRRVDGLLPGTPRELPVPAKELGVFGQALYTWGGATPSSPTPP
ncbi:MAG: hypothetical protein FJ202_01110 [Gemmatimonadetes bacterium]|nr:hypothetical protein [Gemmatimonadota bacterium]